MKINNTDHGSSVSFGTNVKSNRNVSAKKNQGFGQQLADGVLRFAPVQFVLDDELFDRNSEKTRSHTGAKGG